MRAFAGMRKTAGRTSFEFERRGKFEWMRHNGAAIAGRDEDDRRKLPRTMEEIAAWETMASENVVGIYSEPNRAETAHSVLSRALRLLIILVSPWPAPDGTELAGVPATTATTSTTIWEG